MRESVIEKALVKAVKAAGGYCRKVQFIGHRGAPDRLIMLPGRLIWVELKAPGARAKPHQVLEHQRLSEAGQTVLVIDDLNKIKEIFG
ncbi:VRR-NUC domain-containing protein [Snodgrassella alvi]|uniref:VRR-NUC domain-containing protein n=1 Tax=Snodgrassella alvi TaxID=1196083 RepID=UPI003517FD8D